MTHRLVRPLAVAAAALAWAVSAPVPAAQAGHGDRGSAIRYATALEFRAQAAGQFGASVGRPDYFAFANTANAIAAESHAIEQKLIACDIAGAKICVRHLEGLVKTLDRQEDRLSKCGYRGRDARDAADDFADDIEDTFDDLEDEVDDLRVTGPVVVHGGPRHPAILGGPTVVQPPTVVGPPVGSYRPGPSAPAWNGAPAPNRVPNGFEYQGESDRGGVYYGPSRGLSDPGASIGRPTDADGFSGFEEPGSFQPVPNRESYRPVPQTAPQPPRFDNDYDSRFEGPALPGLPPQAWNDRFDRSGHAARLFPVTLVR